MALSPGGPALPVSVRGRELNFFIPSFTGGSTPYVSSLELYFNRLSQRRRVRRHGRTVVVRRNFFTTPARCPSGGVWTASVTGAFYDDSPPRTSAATSRCRR